MLKVHKNWLVQLVVDVKFNFFFDPPRDDVILYDVFQNIFLDGSFLDINKGKYNEICFYKSILRTKRKCSR